MQACECAREHDVVDALSTGRWPERVDSELRAHVASCSLCTDLVAVVLPILDDRDHAPSDARIPSSAVMWWRAQMRARQEATRKATRPITVAQVIALGAALALTVALAMTLSPWLRESLLGAGQGMAAGGAQLAVPAAPAAMGWLMPLFVAVWLLLAPLVIYFAFSED